MSQAGGDSENAALSRRGLDAFSRRDLDAAMAEVHPEVEWHVTFLTPDLPMRKDVYRGHEEVAELWTAIGTGFGSMVATLEEVVAEKDDVCVVRVHWVAKGAASGVEVDRTLFYVLDIAAGLLRRLRPFDTAADALNAAGI